MFRKFLVSGRKHHSPRRAVPAPQSFRPWRALPRLEELEARRTPTVSIGITSGVLTVNCTGANNVVTVDHAATTTTVNNTNFSDAAFSSIAINNVSGDTDNIDALPAKPTAVTGNGNNTVNLGNTTHGMQDILGAVNLKNPPGLTNLKLDDTADIAARIVNLDVSGTTGTVSGLAPVTITYTTTNLSSLTISSGAGSVFNVLRTSSSLTINGAQGSDTVNLGNATNGVQSLQALVSIAHPGSAGTTLLNVNDSANLLAKNDIVMSVSGTTGTIFGLAPATIIYSTQNLNALNVTTGHGNDNVNVLSTPAAIVTTLNSSGGNDAVQVGNSGNGVQDIRGGLVVKNTPSFSTLTVDDSDELTARTVNLSVSGTTGTIGGIAPATITYTTTDLSALNVTTGRGADAVNVQSTAPGIPVTVNSNGGNDVVTVGNSANGVQSILGTLTVRDTPSFSRLVVDDSADPTSRSTTLSVSGATGTISGLAPATIAYATTDLNALQVTSGKGNDTLFVEKTAANIPVTLNSSGGSDSVFVSNGANGVQSILGAVDIENTSGFTALHVNDGFNPTARTATLSVSGSTGTISGLAPANITYATAHVSSVDVSGGSGGNTFFVQSTAAGFVTGVDAGNGNDTINVGNTANSLDGIQGTLDVAGDLGFNSLNINDQGSTGHVINVTPTTIQRSGSATINYSTIQNLQVHPGNPGGVPAASVTVQGTPAKTQVTLDLEAGGMVAVGNAGNSLDDLQGDLAINTLGGQVDLAINDQGSTLAEEYTLAQGGVTRAGSASITYSKIDDVAVSGGSGGNTFNIDGVSPGIPATVNTGTGAGNLVRMRQHDQIADALHLNGQGSSDALGYVAYTTDVYVNLQTGSATDVASFNGLHHLTGGAGNNVIVGDGQEDLTGGTGHNLIISGGGSGKVEGGGQGDILIGAATSYDTNQTALEAILAEWTRPDLTYRQRVEHVVTGDDALDPYPLNATTVHGNGAANTLTGNGGANLYYGTPNDTILDQPPEGIVVHVSATGPDASGGAAPSLGNGTETASTAGAMHGSAGAPQENAVATVASASAATGDPFAALTGPIVDTLFASESVGP